MSQWPPTIIRKYFCRGELHDCIKVWEGNPCCKLMGCTFVWHCLAPCDRAQCLQHHPLQEKLQWRILNLSCQRPCWNHCAHEDQHEICNCKNSCMLQGHLCIRVKQVRFGKLAFPQQNGAIFWTKTCDLGPFRATFSVKKFGKLLCEHWSAGTFGSVRYVCVFQHKNWGFGHDKASQHPAPKSTAKMCTVSKPKCQFDVFFLKT